MATSADQYGDDSYADHALTKLGTFNSWNFLYYYYSKKPINKSSFKNCGEMVVF